MKDFKVNILGSAWDVRLCKESDETRLKDCGGFTDWTSRTIVVLDGREEGNLSNPEAFLMKVLRHEIVHAFMFESGLGDDWEHREVGHDETVVDWIAYQLPKMYAVAAEAEGKLKVMLDDGD